MKITAKLKKAIEKYIEGQTSAFTDIYNESYKYVYVCVNNVVSGNDNKEDIIQDIMQDTYVEISRHIKSLENVDKFFSWVGMIATRKCYEYLKKSGKYTLLNEDENFDNLSDDDNIIPEEVMQNKEKQRLLRDIIQNELTEMQRLCIVGYFYNEMKQSEIAKELGIPENSVKSHLLRAKAKIKEAVIELDEKKGARLYSVSPALLLLFSDEVKACTVSAKIGQSVLSSVGVTAVKTTVAALKLKTLIIAVTSAITVGGVTAGIAIANNNKKDSNEKETTTELTTELLPIDVEFPTIDAPREVKEELGNIAGNWAAYDGGTVMEFIPARGNEAVIYILDKNIYVAGTYETDNTTYIRVKYYNVYDERIRGTMSFTIDEMRVDMFGELFLQITAEDGTVYAMRPANGYSEEPEEKITYDAPREVIESTDSVAGNWASLRGDVIELIPARGNEAEVYLPNKNIFYKGTYESDDKTYIKIWYTDTSDSQHTGIITFSVISLEKDSDGKVCLILSDEDGTEYIFWPAS